MTPDAGVRPATAPPLSDSDTCSKLLDPAIPAWGWTEGLIHRDGTAGAIQVVNARPCRRSRGRVEDTPRVKVNSDNQPGASAPGV
jgi:hypothetical protein